MACNLEDFKIVWIRWHWEDLSGGLVPTPECDWWNYDFIIIDKDSDVTETSNRWLNKIADSQRQATSVDRKVFGNNIERPPRWYIDQQIERLTNNLKGNQDILDILKGL